MAARNLCGVLLFALFLYGQNASSVESSVNQELSNIFNELWGLDVNRMTPGIDYNISVQNRAGFVSQGSTVARDQAPQPLFSNVNEDKLKRTTTFFLLMKLLDNYERSSSVFEQYTPEETTEISLFLDAVLETKVMKRTHQYLVSKGKSSSDLTTFKNQLNWIWFHLYNRQRNTNPDSCGFEHIFVGETRTESEIAGFHNWVQFYLQEKSTHLDYKGFKAGQQDSPDSDDHVLNLQFSWHGALKPVGSAFIGTSPEFEMAVFTILFLMNTERSTKVVVDIDQCQLELLVVRHGNSIGSAFPKLLSSNSRHVRQPAH